MRAPCAPLDNARLEAASTKYKVVALAEGGDVVVQREQRKGLLISRSVLVWRIKVNANKCYSKTRQHGESH